MFLSPVYSLRRLAYQGLLAHVEERKPVDIVMDNQPFRVENSWLVGLKKLRPYWAGLGLAIALVSIACASILVVIAERSMSPGAIAFNRLLIAGIVFALWQSWPSQRNKNRSTEPLADQHPNRWRIMGIFVLAGCSFAGSLGCAAWSLTQTTVANSTLLNNLMPLFTTLGAWLLLGQQFNRRFVIGLAVAIVGVITIGIQDLHLADAQLTGDAAALLAAIFLAITLLCVERLRIHYSTAATMAGLSFIGAAFLLPFVFLSSDRLFPNNATCSLAVVALALISQVVGHGLLTYSLKSFSSSLVSVLMLAIPVMSSLLAAVLFGQHLGWVNSIAFGIVLIGIYLAISGQAISAAQE